MINCILAVICLAVAVAGLNPPSESPVTVHACLTHPAGDDAISALKNLVLTELFSINESPERLGAIVPVDEYCFVVTILECGAQRQDCCVDARTLSNTIQDKIRTADAYTSQLDQPHPRAANTQDPVSLPITLTPSYINFDLQSVTSTLPATIVTVHNSGTSNLIVSAISVPVEGWLKVSPETFVLQGGNTRKLTVTVDNSKLPPSVNNQPLFRVIELHHNIPEGQHAFGVSVQVAPSSIVVTTTNVAVTAVAVVSVTLLVVILACYVKRTCCAGGCLKRGTAVASTVSSSSSTAAAAAVAAGTAAGGTNGRSRVRPKTGDFTKLSGVDDGSHESGTSRSRTQSGDVELAERVPAKALAPAARSDGGLSLLPNPTLRVDEFDAKWASLVTCELWGATARLPLPADSDIERCMGQHRIKCLASGALGDVHKFYFFAEDVDHVLLLVELSLTVSAARFSALVKAASQDKGVAFAGIVKTALEPFTVPSQ